MANDIDAKLKNLKRFNLAMGVLHFLQGCLMLGLSNSFTLPVTRGYLQFNPLTKHLDPVTVTVFDLQIGPLVASFLFISSIAHFLIATVLYSNYCENLKKGINKYRWAEYAISSSIMIVVIMMLVGIYDVGTLLLGFFLNMMMILLGLIMEQYNQFTKKLDWSPFIYGCVAGLIPWIVITIHLFGSGGEGSKPPDFVYYIFLSMAIFFNSFAINMVLQYKKVGKWKDYLYGERMYVILSLVAKSLLAWQVFAGTLRPA
jgi:hypothetical protein